MTSTQQIPYSGQKPCIRNGQDADHIHVFHGEIENHITHFVLHLFKAKRGAIHTVYETDMFLHVNLA